MRNWKKKLIQRAFKLLRIFVEFSKNVWNFFDLWDFEKILRKKNFTLSNHLCSLVFQQIYQKDRLLCEKVVRSCWVGEFTGAVWNFSSSRIIVLRRLPRECVLVGPRWYQNRRLRWRGNSPLRYCSRPQAPGKLPWRNLCISVGNRDCQELDDDRSRKRCPYARWNKDEPRTVRDHIGSISSKVEYCGVDCTCLEDICYIWCHDCSYNDSLHPNQERICCNQNHHDDVAFVALTLSPEIKTKTKINVKLNELQWLCKLISFITFN